MEVSQTDLPDDANIISSHVVFKVKTNDNGTLRLKGLIVVHGNRDYDKDLVRSDCAAEDMLVVRMVVSLAAILGLNVGTADIKGAFMQSGPINRDVHVRPPKYFHRKRGTLWKLLKLPYGMADAGRQWLLRVDNWLLTKANMKRAEWVNQVFVRREDGNIKLIVAEVVDDFLVSCATEAIKAFFRSLSAEFVVGKTAIGGAFRFNGCEQDIGEKMI